MRHVHLWFICVVFVTMSCTLDDPLRGHCGNDRDLGTDDCQCVTSDTEYSSYSGSYERGASYDNLNHCKIKTNVYAQNLDPGDTDIYVCLSYQCATKRCPPDTVPDDDKRKCIATVDCPDPKEVYDRDRNACQCDGDKHLRAKPGLVCVKRDMCIGMAHVRSSQRVVRMRSMMKKQMSAVVKQDLKKAETNAWRQPVTARMKSVVITVRVSATKAT